MIDKLKCEVDGCIRQARHWIKTEVGILLPICDTHFEIIKAEELEIKIRLDKEKEKNDDYIEGLTQYDEFQEQ